MRGSSTAVEGQTGSSLRFPDITDTSLQWFAPGKQVPHPEPATLQALCDNSSLTEKLVARAGPGFAVQRLEESWNTISDPFLRQQFGPVTAQHRFWSRKVLLQGHGEPWVLAHTLMPEHSTCSELRQVLDLGNKPLGRFLFSHPQLLRANLQLVQADEQMWGRRSVFYLFSKPIMVAEFFTAAYRQELQSA